MNNCSYTGARVLIEEEGFICAADFYDQGSFIVVRFNPASISYNPASMGKMTHRVSLAGGWYREDLGVLVIPKAGLISGDLHR